MLDAGRRRGARRADSRELCTASRTSTSTGRSGRATSWSRARKMIGYAGAGEGHSRGDPARMPHRGRRTGQRAVRHLTFFRGHRRRRDRSANSAPTHKFDEAAARARRRWRRWPSTSTRTRRSATRRPPATRCRSTSTRRSPRAAGLPGIIAHGLCTMAFTSWAVLTELAGSDVDRLKRFAVRFSKMVHSRRRPRDPNLARRLAQTARPATRSRPPAATDFVHHRRPGRHRGLKRTSHGCTGRAR